MNPTKCPICSLDLGASEPIGKDLICHLKCPRCGEYEISDLVISQLGDKKFTQLQIANMSGWMREHSLKISEWKEMEYLISISDKTPTVGQKAEKLLLYLSKKYPVPGNWFGITATPEFLGVSWAQHTHEIKYLIRDYLVDSKHFLMKYPNETVKNYTITPEGWAYIENFRYANPESQIGFIAMWFDESVSFLLKDVINPAVEAAGYDPLPINKHQHINHIDDEIMAMIRRSKFIVADFTGENEGAYFESGFALGLGLPVFWLCKKEEFKEKVHFDVNHYKFILWEKDKLSEAKNALQYSIESILGRGKHLKL